MKLTNADLIKNREKELLETISGDLDRDSIRKLLETKYRLELDADSLISHGGDLVVHDNQVAYQVKFQAVVGLSLMFSRQGECLETGLDTAVDKPADPALKIPEDDSDAAVSDREQREAFPDDDAYGYVSPATETSQVLAEDDAPADAFTGQGPDAGEAAADDDDDDYYDTLGIEMSFDESAPPTHRQEAADSNDDEPPAARMASSIADMISEINKT